MAKLSVVIPTLNRSSVVFNTIREIISGNTTNLGEIIIVDQSDVPLIMDDWLDEPRLRYIYTPIKNLPRARNIGAKIAKFDLVLYLDDDVTGIANIIEHHHAAHRDIDADIVTGPIFESKGDLLPDVDPGTRQRHILLQPGFAYGGNASYRREVISRFGGFDENFIGGAIGEDAEMSHRVREGGGVIIFDRQCTLIHLNVKSGGCKNESDRLERLKIQIENCDYFWHKVDQIPNANRNILRLIRNNAIARRKEMGGFEFFAPDMLPRLLFIWFLARRRTKKLLKKAKIKSFA